MTILRKRTRKAIISQLKAKGKESMKKLRNDVLENLSKSDIGNEITKDVIKKIISKLIKKGKLIQTGNKLSLNSVPVSTENFESSTDLISDSQDFQDDEKIVVNHVNNPLTISYPQNQNTVLSGETESVSNLNRGDITILLFYTYCTPIMTRTEQDNAIAYCYSILSKNNITGRLRVGREGFNGTLTGYYHSIRLFTNSLKEKYPSIFKKTDFKYVDGQPERHLLKGLKVWPVTEIVTYGFDPALAPLEKTGRHLTPQEFHAAMEDPRSIMIDVRNFNETLIGKFAPPVKTGGSPKVLDPYMRRSTEFPEWIERNKHQLEGKKVLMYCTGGVRCERASAYVRNLGIDDVSQLEGGIHRYLEAYPQDGGYWIGKNYTFDKRFSHGAEISKVVSACVSCRCAWDRYQARAKCAICAMEVLLCKSCQRARPPVPKDRLLCPLCSSGQNATKHQIRKFEFQHKSEQNEFG